MEKLQKISDPPLVDCPACGKPALQKLVSAAGFRLKGGGWYETDFKKDRKKNLAKDDSGGSDGNKGKGDTGKGDSGKGDSGKGGKSGEVKNKPASGGSAKTG
jgi:putative FmdB family regulatory protein